MKKTIDYLIELCIFVRPHNPRYAPPDRVIKTRNMEQQKTEKWVIVKGFPDYEVSNLGRVKSKNKILSQRVNPDGYYRANLYKNKARFCVIVHKLVWDSFNDIESCGHKLTVDHKDNNKLNNCLDNLQLLTNRQNVAKACSLKPKLSKYTGVTFDKRCNKWVGQIKVKTKLYKLGYFTNEEDAANAYACALQAIESGNLPHPGLYFYSNLLTSKSYHK